VSSIGSGQISQVDLDGQVLHRVRLGPATSVEMADDLLDGVIGLGFTGARIVVD
jgi:rare lipoprotein A